MPPGSDHVNFTFETWTCLMALTMSFSHLKLGHANYTHVLIKPLFSAHTKTTMLPGNTGTK